MTKKGGAKRPGSWTPPPPVEWQGYIAHVTGENRITLVPVHRSPAVPETKQ